jgi:hypothetical protein
VEYSPSLRVVLVSRISKFIWLVTSVIDVLIAFRFVLKLIAANPGNPFTDFIYSLTDFLVGPFSSIVSPPAAAGGSIVDIGSLFAMVAYTVLAFILVQLLRILFASSGGLRQVTTVEHRE